MRFSTVGFLTGVLLTCGAVAAPAQDAGGVAEADLTTQSGSKGVMVRPLGSGPYPAVLHLHGSGDTVANNDHGTLPWNQVYGRVLAFFRTHLR
jgi:poly(3-hydroxybutyrate) depolymerase